MADALYEYIQTLKRRSEALFTSSDSVTVDADIAAVRAESATAETLTAPNVDSVSTFESPKTVVPKPAAVEAQEGKLSLKL